jgi:hypothetical protein
LVRADMSPKPAYERLLELIKGQWWTKTQGTTTAQGELATRAFFGRYRVDLELPDGRKHSQELSWQRGQANRIELAV